MSFNELTTQLEQSFRATAQLLRELLLGLQARRAAWGSARPSRVAPAPELERLAQQLAREEALRSQCIDAIRRMLPAPLGGSAATLHVNVTRIAAALPAGPARSLRDAADEATGLAKQVRVEVTLGQRLLQFTQRVQASLLAGAGAPTRDDAAAIYDRHARAGRAVGPRTQPGVLVDGRM
jgi:hypothetical protein